VVQFSVSLCVPPSIHAPCSSAESPASRHRRVIALSSAPAAAPRFWLGGSDGNGSKNAGARASLQCCLRLQLSLRAISSWPSSSGTATEEAQAKALFWIKGRQGRHWRIQVLGLRTLRDRGRLRLHPWTRTRYVQNYQSFFLLTFPSLVRCL
jgi:hypothetical protein